MLGIIGAMEVEVKNIKNQMEQVNVEEVAGMKFASGLWHGRRVTVVRSGVGKVNAAVCTQILVDRFDVDAVINTGIAGSLRNEINIGDVVLSADALQHDMDARNFGYDLGVIPQMKVSDFAADQGLLEAAAAACEETCPDIRVHKGRVVSGDQFISDKDKKRQLVEAFDPYCTEMEGAAIAQTAYLNQIPFLIIRAISDKADDSASMDYGDFEAMAVANSVKILSAMVEKMPAGEQ